MDENKKLAFSDNSRRGFLRQGTLLIATASVAGLSGLAVSCTSEKKAENEEDEEMVSANEDLMREHGLLQRMLLIYDTAMMRMSNEETFNPAYISQTATIIRNFIEDYHEKLEEDYLFPRLEKAGKLTGLVNTLRQQHKGGRDLTDQIILLTKNEKIREENVEKLLKYMKAFNVMYRPHEAREDTILFPAFKQTVSENEYNSLGEDFEKIEHQKFGEGGFETMVGRVAEIEKQIGIFDLNQFTPEI
jgi:hemerythrin-like domain-containing protein